GQTEDNQRREPGEPHGPPHRLGSLGEGRSRMTLPRTGLGRQPGSTWRARRRTVGAPLGGLHGLPKRFSRKSKPRIATTQTTKATRLGVSRSDPRQYPTRPATPASTADLGNPTGQTAHGCGKDEALSHTPISRGVSGFVYGTLVVSTGPTRVTARL